MLLSSLSNFIHDRLLLKVPMDVGVSNVPSCIKDVPKYLVLKSLYDGNVALFRASPQLYAIGPHRLQYLFVQHQLIEYRQGRSSPHEPVHFFYLYFTQSSTRFFLTCAFQRSLASSVMPRYYGICDVKNSQRKETYNCSTDDNREESQLFYCFCF